MARSVGKNGNSARLAGRASKPFKPVSELLPDRLTLAAVRASAAGCKACDLYARATQTVFGEGPRGAEIMFVGEQPGDVEDLAGHPFVGPAGKLLDRALEEAGIDRASGLRHERREALQVGAARQAAHPREAERRGDRRLPSVARRGDRAGQAARAGLPRRDRRTGAARQERSRCRASAASASILRLPRVVLATVHPSSILRARRRCERGKRRWRGSSTDLRDDGGRTCGR